MSEAKPVVLKRSTLVPISVAVAVGGVLLAVVIHDRDQSNAVISRMDQSDIKSSNRFDNVERKLGEIENRIGAQWTRRDMEEWVRLFFAKNPAIAVVEIPR